MTAVFTHSPVRCPHLSVWARLAAFLSLLAVLSALVAPASMLAQEVRTGQLGGVCHFNALADHPANAGSGDAPQAGPHCDLCGALGWDLPQQPAMAMACFAGVQVADADFPADVVASNPGLPFSRGPPALLR